MKQVTFFTLSSLSIICVFTTLNYVSDFLFRNIYRNKEFQIHMKHIYMSGIIFLSYNYNYLFSTIFYSGCLYLMILSHHII